MPKVRLIALDLDGTLLDSEKRLSDENRRALERAAAEGVEIVPTTGRFYKGMPEAIKNLPFVNYAITINGAQVYDIRNDRALLKAEIPWKRAVEVMEYLDTLPVIYDCYMDNWGWMTKRLYDRAELYAPTKHNLQMILTQRTPVPELKAYLAERKTDVQKIQMFFLDMELRKKELIHLQEIFPDTVIASSIVNNIEVNSPEAQKGLAIRSLAAHLGFSIEETMAFGDGLNDISMIKEAGIGVAMANAADEVKAAADRITESCDENGVAKEIARTLWREV